MNWKEILIQPLLGTLETIGESELEDLLNKLRTLETDPADFDLDIQGTYRLFKRLDKFTKQTKTKIDDAITDTVLTAVENVAENVGIELPEL